MSALHIHLSTPLSLRAAFKFPLQTALSRREILIGAVLLLVPIVGWLLNMGHRIALVNAMQRGEAPWPAWYHWPRLLKHGSLTALGMVYYYSPGAALLLVSRHSEYGVGLVLGGLMTLFATLAIPGYMTHYCKTLDVAEIFNPWRALRRCFQAGPRYWHAWGIALAALVTSFTGLLVFGLGFLVTSVWFWQVAGYSFANAFSQSHQLLETR